MMLTALLVVSLVVLINYQGLLLLFIRRMPAEPAESTRIGRDTLPTVSVLISARNEEQNLEALLQSLEKQDYPSDRWELILNDDESSDGTRLLADNFLRKSTFSGLVLQGEGGKKAGLARCLEQAKGSIVLFTDADCRVPPQWISKHVALLSSGSLVLSAAPVSFRSQGTVWQELLRLEFMALMAAQAGAIGAGHPLMINGANFAARKEAVERCAPVYRHGGPSGDDVFMLEAIKQHYGSKSVGYCIHNTVDTEPPSDFCAFMQQRLRWASKSKLYSDRMIQYTGLTVALMNMMVIVWFVYGLFQPHYLGVFVALLLLKSAVDYPLLRVFARRTHQRKLSLWPLLQVLYPFYAVLIALTAPLLKSYRWKGRSYGRF